MANELTTRPHAGELIRQDLAGTEIQRVAEVQSIAAAAQQKAETEARFALALRFPRDIETFRSKLLKECLRPGFAEEAEYERPVGKEKNAAGNWEQKYVTGPSIRLIETALRFFGNIKVTSPVIVETEEFRLIKCVMLDLETNTSWDADLVVPKRTEKKGIKKGKDWEPPPGREVISSRFNSYGDMTYLVTATDAETTILQNAMISKAQRKNGERLIPKDILTEARTVCAKTLADADSKDPDAAKRGVIDGFAEFNITPQNLADYLSKTLDRIQPADLKELRKLYKAISDEEITWEEALAAKKFDGGDADAQKEAGLKKVGDLLKQKKDKETSPRTDAKVNSGEPTTAKAETSTQPEQPAVEETGNVPVSPAPETKGPLPPPEQGSVPRHIMDLRAWRMEIGWGELEEILKVFGCMAINDVRLEDYPEIEKAILQRAQALGKGLAPTEPEKKAPQKLEFGKKPGK